MEFVGSDGTGRGHNRSRDLHVLWRYDRDRQEWEEVTRILSHGSEWFDYLAPIVGLQTVWGEIDDVGEARAATSRLCALIDGAFAQLTDAGRAIAASVLVDELRALYAQYASDRAAELGGLAELAGADPSAAPEPEVGRKPTGVAQSSAPAVQQLEETQRSFREACVTPGAALFGVQSGGPRSF